MSNVLSPLLKQQFIGPTGAPYAFGELFSYEAGTSTPLATFNPSGGTNANPVILDAAGRADVWIPPNVAYKFSLFDSLGNQVPGFPIDNVTSSQLVTLYGGVDTGAVNAYVLTFAANFSSLTNGIVIYWIPANTNTGASTVNVNGLGAVAITNPDGSALLGSEIIANNPAEIMYYNGAWILLGGTSASSTTNLTGSGCISGTLSVNWRLTNGVVTMTAPTGLTGTSGSTSLLTLTGLPTRIQASAQRTVPCVNLDVAGNSVVGFASVNPNGLNPTQITVGPSPTVAAGGGTYLSVGAGFPSGSAAGVFAGWSIAYSL